MRPWGFIVYEIEREAIKEAREYLNVQHGDPGYAIEFICYAQAFAASGLRKRYAPQLTHLDQCAASDAHAVIDGFEEWIEAQEVSCTG